MRRLFAKVLIAIAVLPVASIHAQTKSAGDADEVKRLEQQRVEALVRGDIKTLEQMLSDDLTYTHSTGRVDTKAEFIGALTSGAVRYHQMDHSDVQARAYNNTVVLTGRSAVRIRAASDEISFQLRFINIYVKRNGRWQMVAWQSTRLPSQ